MNKYHCCLRLGCMLGCPGCIVRVLGQRFGLAKSEVEVHWYEFHTNFMQIRTDLCLQLAHMLAGFCHFSFWALFGWRMLFGRDFRLMKRNEIGA